MNALISSTVLTPLRLEPLTALQMPGEFRLAVGEDFVVEGAAVGIHGDDGGEAIDFEFPDGFG